MEYYFFSLVSVLVDPKSKSLLTGLQYGGIGVIMFYTTSALTKLSIVCFNARLTGLTSVAWTWVHRVFFGIIVCYWIIAFFYQVFLCSPPLSNKSLIYQGKHGPSKCSKTGEPLGITTSVMHMAFDWVLLAVPIYLVLRLQMPWTKKLQCVIPLALGALSSAGASVRTYDGLHPAKDPTRMNHSLPILAFTLISPADHLISQTGWNVCDFLLAVSVTSLPAVKKAWVDLTFSFSNRYFFTINDESPRMSPPRSDDGEAQSDRASTRVRVSRDLDIESIATQQVTDSGSTRHMYLTEWKLPDQDQFEMRH